MARSSCSTSASPSNCGRPAAAEWDATAGTPGPLTPAYASPEQLLGQPITTAADVYSLGVLLAVLLAGEPPFSRSHGERLRQLGDPAGPPPLERWARAQGAAPAARAFRAESRGRRQDLAAIVAKALQEAPDERYGSVELLAADLGRIGEGKPVLARRPTFDYHFSRWLRRNWLVAGLCFTFVVFLVASLLVLAAQNRQVLRERDRVADEARKSERMLGLLLDLLEGSDPARAQGADISVRDVLLGAEPRIEHDLADQPKVRAALFEALGKVFVSLGSFDDAERVLGRARDLWNQTTWPDSAAGAATLDLLAVVAKHRGNFAAAQELIEQGRSLRVAEFGAGSLPEGDQPAGTWPTSPLMQYPPRGGRGRGPAGARHLEPQGRPGRRRSADLGAVPARRGASTGARPRSLAAAFRAGAGEARQTSPARIIRRPSGCSASWPTSRPSIRRISRSPKATSARKSRRWDRLYQARTIPTWRCHRRARASWPVKASSTGPSGRWRRACIRRRLMGDKSPFMAVTLGNLGWLQPLPPPRSGQGRADPPPGAGDGRRVLSRPRPPC